MSAAGTFEGVNEMGQQSATLERRLQNLWPEFELMIPQHSFLADTRSRLLQYSQVDKVKLKSPTFGMVMAEDDVLNLLASGRSERCEAR